jgi:hypothetical protein
MNLQMRSGPGSLKVTATGKFSLTEAKRTFVQMMIAVGQHKADKVLVDGRSVEGDPKTMERFYYGEFAACTVNEHVLRGLSRPRFAYVLSEPLLDPKRLGEMVAVNRGMHVKAFDNVKEARDWLGLDQSETT